MILKKDTSPLTIYHGKFRHWFLKERALSMVHAAQESCLLCGLQSVEKQINFFDYNCKREHLRLIMFVSFDTKEGRGLFVLALTSLTLHVCRY